MLVRRSDRVSLAASVNQPLYLCANLMEIKVKETDNRKQVTRSVQVVGQSPPLKGFLSFSLGTSFGSSSKDSDLGS